MQDFIQAIETVCENTSYGDTTIWDIVEPVIRKHISMLLIDQRFVQLLRKKEGLNHKLLSLLERDGGRSSNREQGRQLGVDPGGRRPGSAALRPGSSRPVGTETGNLGLPAAAYTVLRGHDAGGTAYDDMGDGVSPD